METDLTKYVYEKMIDEASNYQWRIVFDTHKRALEIYFIIAIETEQDQYVQDVNGHVNQSELLQFEEILCFYDKNEQRIVPNNYLYAVPFDLKEGLEESFVDAVLKQLNILISNTRSQLRNFLLDDSQKEFTMQWNDVNMNSTLETMRKTNRYSTNRLTFTEDEEQSLVEQFKEEQHDGLERI